MNASEMVQIVRHRLPVVIAISLTTLIAAVLISIFLPKEYSSRVVFYVSAQAGNSATTAYQGGLLSQARVTSYVQLISSPAVTGPIVASLGLTESPEALASRISASSTSQSVLIDAKVTGSSPEEAKSIADAVGQFFPQLVSDLERPPNGSEEPAVTVRVVENASLSQNPDNVSPVLVGIVGLIVGFGIGCAVVIVRDRLDTAIRTADNLQSASGLPVLTSVISVRGDGTAEREGAFQESFNRLRTNLQFMDVDHESRVYVISSSIPGEGKSTISRNLAIACGSAGMSVLLVDADLRRPTLANAAGLEGAVGLSSVIAGTVEVSVAIQRWRSASIDILTAGAIPPNPSELLGSRRMQELVDFFRKRYDIVLFDTPPLGPVIDAAALSVSCDGLVLIAHAGKATRENVRDVVQSVTTINGRVLGAVLNFAESQRRDSYSNYYGSQDSTGFPITDVRTAGSGSLGARSRAEAAAPIPGRPSPSPRPHG